MRYIAGTRRSRPRHCVTDRNDQEPNDDVRATTKHTGHHHRRTDARHRLSLPAVSTTTITGTSPSHAGQRHPASLAARHRPRQRPEPETGRVAARDRNSLMRSVTSRYRLSTDKSEHVNNRAFPSRVLLSPSHAETALDAFQCSGNYRPHASMYS